MLHQYHSFHHGMFRTYALSKRLLVRQTRAPVPWKGTVFRHWTCRLSLSRQVTQRKPKQCKPWLTELRPMKLPCLAKSISTGEEGDPIARLDCMSQPKLHHLKMNLGSPAVTMGHSPEGGQESLHVPQVPSPAHCFQDLHLHVVHVHVVTRLGFQPWGADRVPRLFTFSLSRKLGKVHKRVPVCLCCGMGLTCGT